MKETTLTNNPICYRFITFILLTTQKIETMEPQTQDEAHFQLQILTIHQERTLKSTTRMLCSQFDMHINFLHTTK